MHCFCRVRPKARSLAWAPKGACRSAPPTPAPGAPPSPRPPPPRAAAPPAAVSSPRGPPSAAQLPLWSTIPPSRRCWKSWWWRYPPPPRAPHVDRHTPNSPTPTWPLRGLFPLAIKRDFHIESTQVDPPPRGALSTDGMAVHANVVVGACKASCFLGAHT